jgi:RNA polymerase sigma-70 factor, ECF subfamily
VILREMSQEEFGHTIESYRRELQAHSYQMLGSIQDAEDMVQEAFLRAWKRRETYTEDTSLRAWLYKITTNICLDNLKKGRRRVIPKTLGDASSPAEAIPPEIREPIWLEPYPDELLVWSDEHPEQQVLVQENISIAFLAALQLLPPRQRAVLLLSDVLDWSASEIAELLDTTVSAVKSVLHRARSGISAEQRLRPAQNADLHMQLAEYVSAWEAGDVEALVALLREDATFSMPPIPSWYRGRDEIGELVRRTIFSGAAQGRWRLVPTHANQQIAFGLYRKSEPGRYEGYGIQVLTFDGSQITDIITFRMPKHIPYFNLPVTLQG